MNEEIMNPFADPHRLPPAGFTQQSDNPFARWQVDTGHSTPAVLLDDEAIDHLPNNFSPTQASSSHNSSYSVMKDSHECLIGTHLHSRSKNDQKGPLNSHAGHYEDFETIDWVKDIARDRCRHRELHAHRHTFLGAIKAYWDSGSGWFCVLVIGLITGLVACTVDIGSTWMSDLKEGVCLEAFWFNKDQCCWSSSQVNGDCPQWYTWSRLFINKDPTGQYPDGYFVGYLFFIGWALIFSTLCVLLVRMFAPYACGSGIPEIKTILSGFIIRGYLGKWTLLIKSIGMVLGVAAGLSLGKEGPMVHMASCVGNIVAYMFPKYGRNEAKKREILSASAAAGVAVAFGAPIGGVLFSLEEASYYFPMKTMFRSFFCAMVSANLLRMLNPYGGEHTIMFHVDYKAQWHVMELFMFAFLGMLGGIFGTAFNKANLYICRLRKTTWLGKYPVREVLIVTLLTAVVSFPHTYLRMNTSELIRLLVSRCNPGDELSICDYRINASHAHANVLGNYPSGPSMMSAMALLAVALVVKFLLTIFTFGIKVPTGLFIPSLAAGAIMGRILGVCVEQLVVAHSSHPFVVRMCKSTQPCINPGLYAMVGAAASLGGVTRMTISLVVVMLELTGGLNYIIPLMVAAMVSKWTGDRLTNGSIYEEHIRLNGYPYLSSHDELAHPSIAAEVMQPRGSALYVITQDSMTIGDLKHLVESTDVKGFPVVTSVESQYLVGWVTRRDLRWALDREYKLDGALSDSTVVNFSGAFSEFDYSFGTETGAATTPALNLRNIVDLAPITVTDQTPMETVLDSFRKLGLRHILVTHNGRLLGILTRKDVLTHVLQHSSMHHP